MGRGALQTRRLSTNAFAAKRAIFAALKAAVARAQPGSPLAGVDVRYSWTASIGERAIYGGGFDFDQPGDDDLEAGQGDTLVMETVTLGVHIRCVAISDGDEPIEDTDVDVEMIADALSDVVRSTPTIAGGNSVTRIVGGQGDYGPTDATAASRLALRLEVSSPVR
jgi:hypothetical protein